MQVKTSEFVKSSAQLSQCPTDKRPEYAFIGRSNVGKSSLINMLVNNSKLAKTSGRPGKTQLINHFLINDSWYLVDLPGYGYAKVSKKSKEKFGALILDYVEKRLDMTNLFVLIDSRLEPQAIDLEFMEFCGVKGIPFSMVFTKIDKLTGNQINKNIRAYQKRMLQQWEEMPVYFATSAEMGTGREELLGYIDTINKQVAK
jgi:GTP-binding protein